MAVHMIVQIAHFVGAPFAPFVEGCLTKLVPLLSAKHMTYSDIRSYAIESMDVLLEWCVRARAPSSCVCI